MRRKTSTAIIGTERTSARAKTNSALPRLSIRRRLLSWYDRNKRDLPWRRRHSDPYAQWVAEIMLQQTRVETVLRYYEPFLSRFPTVTALARADHQTVLKMWEGLGYYRRILHLHQAARELAATKREIPTSADGLRELQGVGDYTAAAIASIAYGEPVAAVDGNVARVIARLLGLPEASTAAARRQIQCQADQLLSRKRPGDFNQAWMDLGSRICLPRTPNCPECPLRSCCTTGLAGGRLPARKPAPKVENCSMLVGMVMHKDRLLVTRRPEGGLWSGLWEFPSQICESRTAASIVDQLASAHSIVVPGHPRKLGLVRHDLTHRRIRFHVYEAQIDDAPPRPKSARWVTQDAFERLPVSTAHRRIHRLWLERGSRAKGR